MDTSAKVFYGVLTALALAALAGGALVGGPGGIVFAFFAILVLGGSLMCVWERSIVRSAFCLMGTFGGTAGFFVLLGADFLAMAQILVYVGGILALILFGVMLSPPDLEERQLKRVIPTAALVGGAFAWIAFRVGSTMGSWAVLDTLP